MLGDTVRTAEREITLDDIEHFAGFTGDAFYAHTDEEAAAKNPFFDGLEENLPGYRAIRTPTLIVTGSHDRAIPAWQQQKLGQVAVV